MLNTYRKKRLKNSTPLYEQNYQRMMALLPDIRRVPYWSAFDGRGQIELQVQVLENFAYTSVITLRMSPLTELAVAADCELTVRLCHDARVAEVIAFQGHADFRHFYQYPNQRMYHPDEKRQVNNMLDDLLRFSLRSNFKFLQVA